VRFIVFHDNNNKRSRILQTSGTGNLKSSISCVIGTSIIPKLDEINIDKENLCSITGYISRVDDDCSYKTSSLQFLYINKRPIDYARISKQITQLYRKSKPGKEFPIFVLNIHVNTEELDVNVQPDKRQVKLHREGEIIEFLLISLEEIFFPNSRKFTVDQAPNEENRNNTNKENIIETQKCHYFEKTDENIFNRTKKDNLRCV